MQWSRWGGSRWLLPLFALAHVGIFAGLFRTIYSIPFSGTGLFYDYAGRILAGRLPYRDFVAEYPPIALLLFTVPRVLGESFRWYYVWFQIEVVLFDLAIVLALYVAAKRWSLPVSRVLGGYTLALLAVGPIALQQFDLFPAAFMLFAVLAFAADRTVLAAALLALGVATKIYPILIAPLFVLVLWRRGAFPRVWPAIGTFVAVTAASASLWLLRAPRSLGVLFNYHAKRGLHIDTTYATIVLILDHFALVPATKDFSFASWNVAGAAATLMVRFSTPVLMVALGVAYWLIDRRLRDDPGASTRTPELVAHASALIVAAAMVTSKVLSPQYLVWLAPFMALLLENGRAVAWCTFALTGLTTYFMYPFHYEAFLSFQGYAIAVMGLRNALLIALTVLLGRSLTSVRTASNF